MVVDVDVVIDFNVVVVVIIIVVLHCRCCRPSNIIIIMITITVLCCYCNSCISESQYWFSTDFSFFRAFTTFHFGDFVFHLFLAHSLFQTFELFFFSFIPVSKFPPARQVSLCFFRRMAQIHCIIYFNVFLFVYRYTNN